VDDAELFSGGSNRPQRAFLSGKALRVAGIALARLAVVAAVAGVTGCPTSPSPPAPPLSPQGGGSPTESPPIKLGDYKKPEGSEADKKCMEVLGCSESERRDLFLKFISLTGNDKPEDRRVKFNAVQGDTFKEHLVPSAVWSELSPQDREGLTKCLSVKSEGLPGMAKVLGVYEIRVKDEKGTMLATFIPGKGYKAGP
jgi:hypothetical protein